MTENVTYKGRVLPYTIKVTPEMQMKCSEVSELFSEDEYSLSYYVYVWCDDSEFAKLMCAQDSYDYTYYIEIPIMMFYKIPIEEFYEIQF
jgi:hypothetical protein